MNKTNNNLDLQITSTIIFILCSIVSLSISLNERNNNKFYNEKEAIYISYYNRIIILLAVLISLYVSYKNLEERKTDREIYKSKLLVFTNTLIVISAIIVLYVSYLNKKENTLTAADSQNTLI